MKGNPVNLDPDLEGLFVPEERLYSVGEHRNNEHYDNNCDEDDEDEQEGDDNVWL